jgi:NADH:ubiquinone oxidoreductase subunit 4 (subunit M)
MNKVPLISLLTFTPLLGGLLVAGLEPARRSLARWLGMGTSGGRAWAGRGAVAELRREIRRPAIRGTARLDSSLSVQYFVGWMGWVC